MKKLYYEILILFTIIMLMVATYLTSITNAKKMAIETVLQQIESNSIHERMNDLKAKIDALEQTLGEDIGQIRIVNEYLMQKLEGNE